MPGSYGLTTGATMNAPAYLVKDGSEERSSEKIEVFTVPVISLSEVNQSITILLKKNLSELLGR